MNVASSRLRRIGDYHALRVITKSEREVLELRYEAGLSIRQIALALGISRSAANDRAWNGMRKIAAYERTQAA